MDMFGVGNMNIEHSAPVSIAFNSGDIWNAPPFPDFPLFNIGFQYGSIDNYITKEYGLSSVGFLSGSILEIPVPVSTPEENSIVYSTFLSGSVFDTIVPEPGGSDSQSITNITFLSGNVKLISIETPQMNEANVNWSIGFKDGFIT